MASIRLVALLCASLALNLALAAQAQQPPAPLPAPQAGVEAGLPAPGAARALTATDLESWLDGLLPYSLERGGVPGAVVAVVKDGELLFAKGYGFSDVGKKAPVLADRTLFRPGSVSKLFTWTAVMQLVDEGKVDLDRDINTYLDFRIPARDDGPITMRHLMTHRPGFEEALKNLIAFPPAKLPSLGEAVKRWTPARIYPAGSTPAYSNYGTAVAGYIVERVSGMPFERYVETHIFQPLGMTHSTFVQPLPESLAADMSKGYPQATAEPGRFELIPHSPAGGLSSTATDMARFMIAHLQNGRLGDARLMSERTAQLMHDWRAPGIGPLNRMALGFYESSINGRRVISHGGDTTLFHSDLHLFLDDGVGLYMSFNSGGKEGAVHPLRSALFEGFADRYLPGPMPEGSVDPALAEKHAALMTGVYEVSRRSATSFIAALGLFGQTKVSAKPDGSLVVSGFDDFSGEPRTWREIAPFVWRDVAGGQRLAAEVKDGKVVRMSSDELAPIMVYDPAPWWRSSAWLLPALFVSLGALLLSTLAWPAGAIARRRYGVRAESTRVGPRSGERPLRWVNLATLLVFVGLAVLVSTMLSKLDIMGPGLDPIILLLKIAALVCFVGGLVLAARRAIAVWRTPGNGLFAKLWALVLVASYTVILWIAVAFRLLSFGMNY